MGISASKYNDRFYRYQLSQSDLVDFQVVVKETDLWIKAERDLSKEAKDLVLTYRYHLEDFISKHPGFLKTFAPFPPPNTPAPAIIAEMINAGILTDTGPMAAVAGAIAQKVGHGLTKYTREVIVENGGDCFIKMDRAIEVGIFAGRSALSNKVALRLTSDMFPIGVCTSSGTVGHSISFGKADAVTVLSKNVAVADAAATAIGNLVRTPHDIKDAIRKGKRIKGIIGIIIIVRDKLGAWGDIELVRR